MKTFKVIMHKIVEQEHYIEAKSFLNKAIQLGGLDQTLENNVEHILGVLSRS